MNYQDHLQRLNYFNSTAGRMAYVDEGQGEVIFLLHGVPTSSWLYRKIIPNLTKAGYRVIAPDMIGFGASDKPEEYDIYSDEQMGKRIEELMNHLQVANWTHVFHDGGGLWTWAFLKHNPERISHLIMMNTIVYQEGFKPPLKFTRGAIAKLYARQYSTVLGQRIVIHPTFKNGIKNKSVVTKEMLEGYKIPFLDNGYFGLYYFFTQTCRQIEDYTALHKSLNIPTTVIWGEHDDMLVWNENADLVKVNLKVQDNDIYLLNAKHFIQEECSNEITAIILNKMTALRKGESQ